MSDTTAATRSAERLDIIVNTLKEYAEPVQFADLVELTKERIEWTRNPRSVLLEVLKLPGADVIHKIARGLYEYKEPERKPAKKTNVEIVCEVLKNADKPMNRAAIQEATKDQIVWNLVNPSSTMNVIAKKDPRIVKGPGHMYTFQEEPAADESQNPPAAAEKVKGDDIEPNEEGLRILESFRSAAPPVATRKHTKPTKHYFELGETVTGVVTGIKSYGVFLVIRDEDPERDGRSGLIHISAVRPNRILYERDLYTHFRIGQEVSAKVVAIKPEGQLSLSTKEFNLPYSFGGAVEEPNEPEQLRNSLADKLGPHLDKLQFVEQQQTESVQPEMQAKEPEKEPEKGPVLPPLPTGSVQSDKLAKEPTEKPVQNEQKVGEKQVSDAADKIEDARLEEIWKYLNPFIGMVSPDAQARMKELIAQHGMFKFTIGMTKATSELDKDWGVILAEMIDQKISGGL